MAENPVGEPQLAALIAKAVAFAPGFAGAVLSLAFVEALTVRGRVVAVATGLTAAAFIAPGLVALVDLVWPGDMPKEAAAAISCLTGVSAIGVLPPLLGWLKRVAGDPLSLLKVRLGPAGGEGA